MCIHAPSRATLSLWVKSCSQVMTFDGWVDHLLREMLNAVTDDWFRVRPAIRVVHPPRVPGRPVTSIALGSNLKGSTLHLPYATEDCLWARERRRNCAIPSAERIAAAAVQGCGGGEGGKPPPLQRGGALRKEREPLAFLNDRRTFCRLWHAIKTPDSEQLEKQADFGHRCDAYASGDTG